MFFVSITWIQITVSAVNLEVFVVEIFSIFHKPMKIEVFVSLKTYVASGYP